MSNILGSSKSSGHMHLKSKKSGSFSKYTTEEELARGARFVFIYIEKSQFLAKMFVKTTILSEHFAGMSKLIRIIQLLRKRM